MGCIGHSKLSSATALTIWHKIQKWCFKVLKARIYVFSLLSWFVKWIIKQPETRKPCGMCWKIEIESLVILFWKNAHPRDKIVTPECAWLWKPENGNIELLEKTWHTSERHLKWFLRWENNVRNITFFVQGILWRPRLFYLPPTSLSAVKGETLFSWYEIQIVHKLLTQISTL